MNLRRKIIDRLMTNEMREEIYKDLWNIAKKKGRLTHEVKGKKVTYEWSNADKVVAEMPYEVLADDQITNWSPRH